MPVSHFLSQENVAPAVGSTTFFCRHAHDAEVEIAIQTTIINVYTHGEMMLLVKAVGKQTVNTNQNLEEEALLL